MSIIKSAVDQLFAMAELARGRTNPVTGEPLWGHMLDNPESGILEAYRAVLAREWFAVYGPPDVLPLPLTEAEIENLKWKGDRALAFARFAASLKANDWDFKRHPGFEEFIGGLLCLSDAELPKPHFKHPEDLVGPFRPCPLQGLWSDGIWRPVH